MHYEVVRANEAHIEIRPLGTDQTWTFYIVERDGKRVMSETLGASQDAAKLGLID